MIGQSRAYAAWKDMMPFSDLRPLLGTASLRRIAGSVAYKVMLQLLVETQVVF